MSCFIDKLFSGALIGICYDANSRTRIEATKNKLPTIAILSLLIASCGGGGDTPPPPPPPAETILLTEGDCSGDRTTGCSIALSIESYSQTADRTIGNSDDEDFYKLIVPSSGIINIWTEGDIDTEGQLLGADGEMIARSDLSQYSESRAAEDSNFLLSYEADAGEYYIVVRGSPGTYKLGFSFISASSDGLKDRDSDGIPDKADNCIERRNNNQLNTDTDNEGDACDEDDDDDGVADREDAFPLDSTESSDLDEDGVGDNEDNCRSASNPDQQDTDRDSEGDACDEDDDNDQVLDEVDNCRFMANEDQTDTDRDGFGDSCDEKNDLDVTCDQVSYATNCDIISISDSVDGVISAGMDEYVYAIIVPRAVILTVETLGEVRFTLYASSNERISEDYDREGITRIVGPGVYYIGVNSLSSSGGSFTLQTSFDADFTSISISDSVDGTITTDELIAEHVYAIMVPSAGVLTVELEADAESSSSLGALYDGSGKEIDLGSSSNQGNQFQVPTFRIVRFVGPGVYYIDVQGERQRRYYSWRGSYTLRTSLEEGLPSIGISDSVDGAVSDDETEYAYAITVPSAGILTVETMGEASTSNALYDGLGERIDREVDYNYNYYYDDNNQIVQFVRPGIYYIGVRGDYPWGSYTLQTSFEAFIPIGISDSAEGTISSADVDYYTLTVNEPGFLIVQTEGDLDTVGILLVDNENFLEPFGGPSPFDRSGSFDRSDIYEEGEVAFDNNDGEGYNFRIVYLADPGTYRIDVTSRLSSSGSYRLRTSFKVPVEISVSDLVNGAISAGDEDYYQVMVEGSGFLTLQTMGLLDTVGALYDSSGVRLVSDDDGGVGSNFSIEESVSAGTYYLGVSGFDFSTTGSYSLQTSFGASPSDGMVDDDTLDCPPILNSADTDGDGVDDGCDVDDDGDGLIEIRTAEGLDSVRHQLDGLGFREAIDGKLDQRGCGGSEGISDCSGYELGNNISLASYRDADDGKGWLPIGESVIYYADPCGGEGFSGIFDGNGYAIKDLEIARAGESCIGLFGILEPAGSIDNLSLEGGSVVGSSFVGGLVGSGDEASIRNSFVDIGVVVGDGIHIGGLIGSAFGAMISSSSAEVGNLTGVHSVGGLVGEGDNMILISSYAKIGNVSAREDRVGGLVGDADDSEIRFSSAVVENVTGDYRVGGLAGSAIDAVIDFSYVRGGVVRGRDNIGGLIGSASGVNITSSSVWMDEIGISGYSNYVGGLVGNGNDAIIMNSSAVSGLVVGGDGYYTSVGGLVGQGYSAEITNSYAISGSVSGSNRSTNVGGLVGVGGDADILNSYAISGLLKGSNVGGLVGYGGDAEITNAYVVFGSLIGSDVGGLVGDGNGAFTSSYWNSTVGTGNSSHLSGSQTSTALRSPTSATGIYADWTDDGDCGWDFGTSEEYPALLCLPALPEEQRGFYNISETHTITIRLPNEGIFSRQDP